MEAREASTSLKLAPHFLTVVPTTRMLDGYRQITEREAGRRHAGDIIQHVAHLANTATFECSSIYEGWEMRALFGKRAETVH